MKNTGGWLHCSLDDVIGCFKWIYENKPVSIFDEPMLSALKGWNKAYGVHFDLYVFEKCQGFCLDRLPDRYWKELGENSSWLKLAWHRRVSGPIRDEMEEEIKSLNRVHNLVTKKAAMASWSEVVRLHRWEASDKLLLAVKETNIHTLLTTDNGDNCYKLSDEENDFLQNNWIIESNGLLYRKTNIRFDDCIDENKVMDAIAYTEEFFANFPMAWCIEVFFHEHSWEGISRTFNLYLDKFQNISMPLFTNAAVRVKRKVYFTVCNLPVLFCLDEETSGIEPITLLPGKTGIKIRFSALVYFEQKIWMIPWVENFICVYDMTYNKTDILNLEFLTDEKGHVQKFRKSIQDGKYIWLLPCLTCAVIRIDMTDFSYIALSKWPDGIEFASDREMNFKMMTTYSRGLFLIREGCSHNIRIDMDTLNMAIWDVNISNCFAEFLDNEWLIVSPLSEGEELKILSMESGKTKKITLPDWVWCKVNYYAFWYLKRIEDIVFLFPHDARAAICYDCRTTELEIISLSEFSYKTIRTSNCLALYDVFKNKKGHLLFSYHGNLILQYDMQKKQLNEIRLSLSLKEYQDWKDIVWDEEIVCESGERGLLHLLKNCEFSPTVSEWKRL